MATAAAQAGVPFAELRTISNPVGPRDRASWRLPEALAALTAATTALWTELWTPAECGRTDIAGYGCRDAAAASVGAWRFLSRFPRARTTRSSSTRWCTAWSRARRRSN